MFGVIFAISILIAVIGVHAMVIKDKLEAIHKTLKDIEESLWQEEDDDTQT